MTKLLWRTAKYSYQVNKYDTAFLCLMNVYIHISIYNKYTFTHTHTYIYIIYLYIYIYIYICNIFVDIYTFIYIYICMVKHAGSVLGVRWY